MEVFIGKEISTEFCRHAKQTLATSLLRWRYHAMQHRASTSVALAWITEKIDCPYIECGEPSSAMWPSGRVPTKHYP